MINKKKKVNDILDILIAALDLIATSHGDTGYGIAFRELLQDATKIKR